jgi:PBP1b-binding outer membrane lipoprotein LpoB
MRFSGNYRLAALVLAAILLTGCSSQPETAQTSAPAETTVETTTPETEPALPPADIRRYFRDLFTLPENKK